MVEETSMFKTMNPQQKFLLELACRNEFPANKDIVKRELLPLVASLLDKDKMSISQINTNLKLVSHNIKKNPDWACDIGADYIDNLLKRVDVTLQPFWI
jgi:hypothetical protein